MPRLAPVRWAARIPTGLPLVVCAAALWGTDALFRRPLALELPASVVVFAEHLLLVALTAPLLVRGLKRGARSFDRGDWLAVLLVGAGAPARAEGARPRVSVASRGGTEALGVRLPHRVDTASGRVADYS